MIIGLTGGIGSGKSTVLKMFIDLGVPTTSADIIARDILDNDTTVQTAIANKFTPAILNQDGKINRKLLRTKIFNSDVDRLWLDKMMHPKIKQRIIEFAQSCHKPYCIVEVPLLLESKWHNDVDRILVVDTTPELQVERVSKRDAVTTDEINKVITIQVTSENRRNNATDLLINDSTLESLESQVKKLFQSYNQLSTPKN